MKTLRELAVSEERLLSQVEALTGTFEAKYSELESTGIPQEYAAIATMYADLLTHPTDRSEALKRALFLVWYAVAEPPVFTGLSLVGSVHRERVLDALEAELTSGRPDDELLAMLRWYVAVDAAPTLRDRDQHSAVGRAIAAAEDADEEQLAWRPAVTEGRGQLGAYWRSLRDDA